ncbi:MFS transporter [Metabacillus fastidiosus]|uniref:MFS transporter n=1 Tax=Metabacillus fastidiosus TaxID=1458 RepID=A0ABU6NZG9_9BACI|nr:MFS transporter [Metabacillus fastidiosus]MED4402421.1 MFS transporter [Metabacillus fastidiosus]
MNKKISESESARLQEYIGSPEKQQQLYRKTLIIVVLAQIFGGAGLAAGVTVGALLAQDMLGSDSFGGIPSALFTLGSAGAALSVGWLSQRFGRRTGLTAGFFAGGIGAIGIIIAAATNNLVLLFASLLIYGSGMATNLQARYAGTDLASPKQRATAISISLVSTTFGAVAGPNLVNIMGKFAESFGLPALAGPFILAAAAFTLAGLVLLIFLRPDPFLVSQEIMLKDKTTDSKNASGIHPEVFTENKRGIITGAAVMVLTQIIMVMIMTMTPIHMEHHGHGLNEVGIVISIHIGAMYLPSLVTGILVDKLGRIFMAIASGATLLAAGLIAALAPGHSMTGLIIALALLGLGWNFGLISGTALIIDSAHLHARAKTQGTVDVLVALAGASGGALSGMIVVHSSYTTLAFAGGIFSLLLIPVIVWSLGNQKNTNEKSRSLHS